MSRDMASTDDFDGDGSKSRSDFEAFCEALGFFVVNWALAEQSLDKCVLVVFNDYGGNKWAKSLPRAYEAKALFLRKSFAELEELSSFVAEAISILDCMDALASIRNDWVHGVVSSIEAENNSFRLEKMDYRKQKHAMRTVTIQFSDYPEIIGRLIKLGGDVARFGLRLEGRTPFPRIA